MDVDVAAVAPNTPTRAPGSPREFVRTRSRTVSNRASQSAMVVTPTKQLIAAVSDLELDTPTRSRKRSRLELLPDKKEDIENGDETSSVKTPKKKAKLSVGEKPTPQDLVSKLISRTTSFTKTLRGKSVSKKLLASSSNPTIPVQNKMDVDSIPARSASSSATGPSNTMIPSASSSIVESTEVVSSVASPQRPRRSRNGSELKSSYSCATLPRNLRPNRLSLFTKHSATSFGPMIAEEAGWVLETGSTSVTSMELSTTSNTTVAMPSVESNMRSSSMPVETDAWYQAYFKNAEHFNFLAVEDVHGPVSISVMRDGDLIRAIVRTEKVQEKLAVPASVLLKGSGFLSGKKDGKNALLKAVVPSGWHLKAVREVKEAKHIDELVMFETNETQTKFKWGVLYVKHGQTAEDDMFANCETSAHFKEFLETLGDKIVLKDWAGYTGGLDTNKNMTGTHSIHTNFQDHQIMFHVAPMLPYDAGCTQQLERKRHLGNDVVVIVFVDNENETPLKENDPAPYVPTTIRTHFQHVLAVVQRDPSSGDKPKYRVHVSRKNDVPAFGPELPSPSLFDRSQLRNVLLTKLINGERAALKAPAFEKAISRTRSGFIQYYHQEYPKK